MENGLLRERSSGLLTENQELRQRLGLDALPPAGSVRTRPHRAPLSRSQDAAPTLTLLSGPQVPAVVQAAVQAAVQGSGGDEAGLGVGSSESAALRLRVPPQQVQAQHPLNLKTSQWIQMVLTLQTMR